MKKKLGYGIGGALLLAALVVMITFAFGGGEEPEAGAEPDFAFDGTWRVVNYMKNGEPTIIENEFMVFEGDTVTDYRDGSAEPAFSAQYAVSGSKLSLPDLSRTYTVEKKTDSIYRFCEAYDVYMDLVRWPDSERGELNTDGIELTGKWMISFRVTEKSYEGDYLVFEDGKVSQFLAGSDTAATTADYEIDGRHLVISGWKKDMAMLPLSDRTVILVELTEYPGYLWELTKAE